MAGMSLDNIAAQNESDIGALRQLDNMTHEEGFGEQGGGENLSDMGYPQFDDFSQYAQPQFSDPNASALGASPFTNAFEQQQQTAAPAKPDWSEAFTEAAINGIKATLNLFLEVLKSFASRTVDDVGFCGTRAIKVGAVFFLFGVLILLMAAFTGLSGFGFFGLGGTVLWGGLFTSGYGLVLLLVAHRFKSNAPPQPAAEIAQLEDTADQTVSDYIANIEDSLEHIVSDDLMDELEGILSDDTGCDYTDTDVADYSDIDYKEAEDEEVAIMPDFDALERAAVSERRTISRSSLITTFLPYFMQKTPQFRESSELPVGSAEYDVLRVVVFKVVANLMNVEISAVKQKFLSARETFFSYKIVFERVKKLKNLKDIERELETYFRTTVNDPNLSEEDLRKQRLRIKATVEASGDTWEITINKGTSGIITFGDCLAGTRELEYYKNEKNALPIIAGITESGSVILEDAQYLDNLMITGKQRSGKSWYVNAILTSMLTFNSPEEISLIIIDPKNSTMFNTLALFPHVIGIHDGIRINDILREIVDVEAVRRATTLREARCENIKDYNAAHPDKKMPRIYIVVDEVISVLDELKKPREGEKEADGKQREKEFKSSMLTILSKLPYVGIGMIFVPHRATGIIDKTARTLLKLKAAVMAEDDEIDETLGEKIDRRLTAAGDIAMRTASMESARYVRGPAVADNDIKTAETLRRIAKGFYSMGVEVPKWGHLTEAYVDNSENVKTELFGNTNRVQY